MALIFGFFLFFATFFLRFSSSRRFYDACFFIGFQTRPKELVRVVNIEGTAVLVEPDLLALLDLTFSLDDVNYGKSEREYRS
jgi:hypothetical protein